MQMTGIDNAFAIIITGGTNSDIESIVITGATMKAKKGPDHDFQKYLFTMFKTPSMIEPPSTKLLNLE